MKYLITPSILTITTIICDNYWTKTKRNPLFYILYFIFFVSIFYCTEMYADEFDQSELKYLQTQLQEYPESSLTSSQRDYYWKLLNHHCALCLLHTNDSKKVLEKVRKKLTHSQFSTTEASLVAIASLCCKLTLQASAVNTAIALVHNNLSGLKDTMNEILTDMHKCNYHAEMAEFYQELLWRDALDDDD